MPAPSIEPPALPTDNVPKPKVRRTLLLWVVLVAMFTAIYALMSPSKPRARTSQPAAVQREERFPILPVALGGGVVLFVALLAVRARHARTYNRDSAAGIAAMNEGNHALAEREFLAVSRKHRTGQVGALALYNLALAQVEQGKLRDAEEGLTRVEGWTGVQFASDLRVLVAIRLTAVFALEGKVDLARRWLDDARRRYDRNPRGMVFLGELVLVELLLLAREGKAREVIDGFDQRQSMLEGTLVARSMRIGWLLRAFAAWQESGPRDQGAVAPLVRRLQGGPREDLAAFAAEWPELRSFLVTHDLIAIGPAASP